MLNRPKEICSITRMDGLCLYRGKAVLMQMMVGSAINVQFLAVLIATLFLHFYHFYLKTV